MLWRIYSALGDIISPMGGDIISALGGDIIGALGEDVISTFGDVISALGGDVISELWVLVYWEDSITHIAFYYILTGFVFLAAKLTKI